MSPGKISSSPASHLATLCNQMVNFLGIMQNEWAGAQAFSSFDTYLAPFVKADNLSYREVKRSAIESFIFGVNTPSRWGTQAPFSNITLDWIVPKDLANTPAIVGGKNADFTYGDCKAEMDMVKPRVHRNDDRRRCKRTTGIPVSDPDILHHKGFRLVGNGKQQASL